MPGQYNPAKQKPKVQFLQPSTGGVLRSEDGGVYAPVTPVRHFRKPRSAPHVLQPIDKARKRRFLEKIQKRTEEQRQREHQTKQQYIHQELVKRLAEQRAKKAACAEPRVGTALSAARWLPLCCGAWVPCNIRYPEYSSTFDSDSVCASVSSVCSPVAAEECK